MTEIALEIPAQCRFLAVAAGFIKAAAGLAGFDEDGVEAIEIAVMEAVENVIDHAGASESEMLRIELHPAADSLIVDVKDRGAPWPRKVLTGEIGRDMPPPESPRGRGLAMMHALMDEVIPRQAADGTKTLRLVKKRPTARVAGQGAD